MAWMARALASTRRHPSPSPSAARWDNPPLSATKDASAATRHHIALPLFCECGDGCSYWFNMVPVRGERRRLQNRLQAASKAPGRAALGITVQQKQVTITHQVINDDLWLGVVTDVAGCC
jgi:hypothetical protein